MIGYGIYRADSASETFLYNLHTEHVFHLQLTFVTPGLAPFDAWNSSVLASLRALPVYVHPP